MGKLKLIFIISLVAAALLLVFMGRLSYSWSQGNSSYAELSVDRNLNMDDGTVAFSYSTHNDTNRALNYTYSLYKDDAVFLSDTALVQPNTDFSVGTRIDPKEDKTTRLRLVVYREDHPDNPVVDITRYVKDAVSVK